MLYPRESESREVKELNGIWKFRADGRGMGNTEQWFAAPLEETIPMPVPASYNDITQDKALRDHIGDVWYERDVFAPGSWANQRIVLRIGSASHTAAVWVNGKPAVEHKGGFLPFEAEISDLLKLGKQNRITVRVNNILDWTTLPPGKLKIFKNSMEPIRFARNYPEGHTVQDYYHDFFNYSGIHRPVRLYTTPKTYVKDVAVTPDIRGRDGIVHYQVEASDVSASVSIRVLDRAGNALAFSEGAKGTVTIENAAFWSPDNPALYALEAQADGDIYRQPFGIRTVKVEGKQFLLNGKPFYFTGFGKHEDSNLRGKGHDDVVNVKDFNLMKWTGANSFRTSHYPYSEEIMNLADEMGFVVIDEAPAVGMNFSWDISWEEPADKVFCEERVGSRIQQHHLDVMRELVARDKNHPSVVLWCVANEAAAWEKESCGYFEPIVEETRRLDPSRPVTIVHSTLPDHDYFGHLFDVICVNRYYSWYGDSGELDLIPHHLSADLKLWFEKHGKPVMLTEYGCDTIPGFHQDPPVMFTEEYQVEFYRLFHETLDALDFIIGEQVWNFADFATKQGVKRVDGNHKGIFTRDRRPKTVAFHLRDRWLGKLCDLRVKNTDEKQEIDGG